MMCYNPISVRVNISKYHNDCSREIYVPCGKCLACLSQKSHELAMRCQHESFYYNYGRDCMFLTLTYDKKYLPEGYSLSLDDLQKFFKRLRYRCDKELKLKIKYFACGEYGHKRGRPHYHAIIFGLSYYNKLHRKLVEESWTRGFKYFGTCTADSIGYCSKYMMKDYYITYKKDDYKSKTGREKPFRVMSKGLGKRYCLDFADNIVTNLNIMHNGIKMSIPRTYVRWLGIQSIVKEFSKEKRLEELKDIALKFNLSFDLYSNNEDYQDIYSFSELYDLWANSLRVKRKKWLDRHEFYLLKLDNKKKVLPLSVA